MLATISEVRRKSGFVGAQIRLWDAGTLQPTGRPVKVDYIAADSTLAFSPDSRYLLCGHESQVFLGEVTASQPALRNLKNLGGTSAKTSFSGDGRMLALQRANRNTVLVLETASQMSIAPLQLRPGNHEIESVHLSRLSPPPWPAGARRRSTSGTSTLRHRRLPSPGRRHPPARSQRAAPASTGSNCPLMTCSFPRMARSSPPRHGRGHRTSRHSPESGR